MPGTSALLFISSAKEFAQAAPRDARRATARARQFGRLKRTLSIRRYRHAKFRPQERPHMPNICHSLAVLAIGGLLTSGSGSHASADPATMPDTVQVSLAPGTFTQLGGWSADRLADAVPAFVKSCHRAMR